jgi:hypothetical protein
MQVDSNSTQRIAANEKPSLNAPMEIKKEILRETTVGNQAPQKQMLALMASAQPAQNVQKTAQTQIQKGYLDIKI